MKKSKNSPSPRRFEIFLRLLPLPYFLAATFSHDWVSKAYVLIFNQFGRTTMEWVLHWGSVLLLGILIAAAFTYMRAARTFHAKDWGIWLITVPLLFGIDRLLICTNIERIHFPQYAILALLLKITIKDDFLVLFLCTLGGIFDEGMQYVIYPKYTRYLDFNDFILNLGGAVLGLLIFGIFRKESGHDASSYTKKLKLVTYTGTTILFLLLMTGYFLGRVVPYSAPTSEDLNVFTMINGKLRMVLSFVQVPQFWMMTGYGRTYHILRPLEGMILLASLLFFYGILFSWSRGERKGKIGREIPKEADEMVKNSPQL